MPATALVSLSFTDSSYATLNKFVPGTATFASCNPYNNLPGYFTSTVCSIVEPGKWYTFFYTDARCVLGSELTLGSGNYWPEGGRGTNGYNYFESLCYSGPREDVVSSLSPPGLYTGKSAITITYVD